MKKLFMLCCASLLAACSSQSPSTQANLDGEVFYLQRIALPPAATLSVELQDVSLMDAPAVTLARQAGPVKGSMTRQKIPNSDVRDHHKQVESWVIGSPAPLGDTRYRDQIGRVATDYLRAVGPIIAGAHIPNI